MLKAIFPSSRYYITKRFFKVNLLRDGRYNRFIILAISYSLDLLIALAGSLDSTITRA